MTDDGDELGPEEAFALFGHDLRVSILLELREAEDRSLPFSELRRRVGERDSGKFNYHLSKLVGRFVAHDEATDEYALRYPGHHVIDLIDNGVFHEDASVEDVSLSADCVDCGGPLRFDYDASVAARVRCRDCERLLIAFPFDPGGLADREGSEVARAFDRRTRSAWRQAHAGVCPVCSGPVEAGFDGSDEQDLAATHDFPVLVSLDCVQCSFFTNVPPGALLLGHPAVVSFLYERGVDPQERRLWDLQFVVDAGAVAVESRDPRRVSVAVEAAGEERTAAFDEDVAVSAFE